MSEYSSYCMQWGLGVGVLTSLSFLATMYGGEMPLVGLVGNVLGIAAFVVAGRRIRAFRREVEPVGFWRACYLALLTYLFASLLTAAVQYVYLAFLDHGRLLGQVERMMAMPEYQQWMEQLAGGTDAEGLMRSVREMVANPARMTMQLMWTNALVSLMLALPTGLMGMRGNN